jgi:ribosome-binding factor A
MSFRKQQVESLLKRAISQVLTQKLSDPRVTGMVSVTRVEVSPDFHNAFVYVTILPEKAEKTTLHGLKHAVGHIYNAVCKLVALKTVPKMEFRLDKAFKKEAAVLGAIRRGLDQEKPRDPARGDAAGASELFSSPEPSSEDQAP